MAKAKKQKTRSAEDVAQEAFPGFDTVTRPARGDKYLSPDSRTPNEKKLHSKYGSNSAKVDAVLKKPKTDAGSATQAVVVQPKNRTDAAAKRLTVLVKKGKIRAVQG